MIIRQKAEALRLGIEGVTINFDGLMALKDISIEVAAGSLHAFIGPNGAGKTSLINCITGFYKPQHGRIMLGEKNLVGLSPNELAKLGVARTFQNIELFHHLTVIENLLLGRYIFSKTDVIGGGLFWPFGLREEVKQRAKVEEIVNLLEMEAIRWEPVGTLPYGLRKRVEFGRALAMEPRLLLLDEPVVGMNVEEKEDMVRFILEVKEQMNITIVLVEHDMDVVMDISEYITVLSFGEKIAEGTPEKVRNNPKVIDAYLGTESDSKKRK